VVSFLLVDVGGDATRVSGCCAIHVESGSVDRRPVDGLIYGQLSGLLVLVDDGRRLAVMSEKDAGCGRDWLGGSRVRRREIRRRKVGVGRRLDVVEAVVAEALRAGGPRAAAAVEDVGHGRERGRSVAADARSRTDLGLRLTERRSTVERLERTVRRRTEHVSAVFHLHHHTRLQDLYRFALGNSLITPSHALYQAH